jgi:hypothetical protein
MECKHAYDSTFTKPEAIRYDGGKWVGWTKDGARIISVAATPEAVRRAARQRGLSDITIEWVLPANERFFSPRT